MSQNITFNGVAYVVPSPNDTGWGQNLTSYLVAIPAGALQKTGGNFALLADVNFGASYGLISTYFKSRTANVASAGAIRLAASDAIKFRNATNSADVAITTDASDNLVWGGAKLLYTGAVVNADINASAAIALSKLATVTASKALASNASGVIVATSVTDTELGYLSGVSSALQTQINAKAADNAVIHKTGVESADGNKTFTGLVGIGATAATYALRVKGGNTNNMLVDNDGSQYTELDLGNNGTTKFAIWWDNTAGYLQLGSGVSQPVHFGSAVTFTGDALTADTTEYGATSTIVGFSAFATKLIYYRKLGKRVDVWYHFVGTSDASSITFTLPFTSSNTEEIVAASQTRDAGTWNTTPGVSSLPANSATVTVYKDFAGAGWTASGTKSCHGQFWYYTA